MPGPGDRVEGGPRVRENGRARLGQPDRSSRPVKQFLAELAFQLADLSAHPGLGDMHAGRGPGEVGLLGHGDKVVQLPKFHKR